MAGALKGRALREFSRWGSLVGGMCLVALGIDFTARAGIGTTPISSLPFTASIITGLTFGQLTIALNCFFFFMQWALLGKRFRWKINLIQFPLVFLFGIMIDACMWAVGFIPQGSWYLSVAVNMAGNVILALGVVLEVYSCTTSLPGEGIVIAMSLAFRRPFAKLKVQFDWVLVALAAALGLVFAGQIIGIREGTVLSAVTTGFLVNAWQMLPALSRLEKFNS